MTRDHGFRGHVIRVIRGCGGQRTRDAPQVWYGPRPIAVGGSLRRPRVARADDSHGNKLLLAVIALIAAVPMLHMGIHDRIDYDGWWHVFIAREAPWSSFWADVYRNAHPPLFYLLLRPMTWLGSGRLVYRALSIAAAVVATYVVGRIATRVFRTPAVYRNCIKMHGLIFFKDSKSVKLKAKGVKRKAQST